MDESKKTAQLGVAQAGIALLVPSDHPENVMNTPPPSGDLIAETAAGFNVDKGTASVLVGLGGDFWARLIRHAEDPVRFPLRRRATRKAQEAANG